MNKTDGPNGYISWEKNTTSTSATDFPTSDGLRVPKSCCARFESGEFVKKQQCKKATRV